MAVEIRKPRFELYQLVTLSWNQQQHQTKIVQRWFNPDDGERGYWFYKVSASQNLYPEPVLKLQ